MIITLRSGRHVIQRMAWLSWCLAFSHTAQAWQQEYIAEESYTPGSQRYTWDNDRRPSYNDILAERIESSQRQGDAAGLAILSYQESAAEPATLGVGWNITLPAHISTGPVASWRWDGSNPASYNDYGDSAIAAGSSDKLWHASVSTFGWRVDSRLGYLRPWAQISYNQQYGENIWKAQSGMHMTASSNQYGSWMDVTVGADMPINRHMAAYASLSQADGMAEGEVYLYSLGVNARF
ncbi:autotransporter domain-containing protein [Franconibacter daqui]|uniref:Autotransporter domain-containing protein n=1 Tax=Franconibacter daqui TaxID=2047724 RepID=A0ABV1PND9_9ENTR|nr:autotransporter domain-containing protein [Franconibacter daqui]GGD29811.1 outer membrane autotransporter barrel domain-containing protein [Franconibacter daqui]